MYEILYKSMIFISGIKQHFRSHVLHVIKHIILILRIKPHLYSHALIVISTYDLHIMY